MRLQDVSRLFPAVRNIVIYTQKIYEQTLTFCQGALCNRTVSAIYSGTILGACHQRNVPSTYEMD